MNWIKNKIAGKEIAALHSKIFELEHAWVEANQFERIASEKLAIWVLKHDELLIKYKQLQKDYDGQITSKTAGGSGHICRCEGKAKLQPKRVHRAARAKSTRKRA
jgi:hypothetical protein